MHGSPYVRHLFGRWDNWGTSTTDLIPIPTGVTLTKGTLLNTKTDDLSKYELASGGGTVGFTTQDLNNEGRTNLGQTLLDDFLGVDDTPVRKGAAISCRKPYPGGMTEFEGLGVARPGNLVITTGTGALGVATARKSELSCLMGGIRLAQSGDLVIGHLDQTNLTPEISGNLRIRMEWVSPYIMP